MPEDSNDVIDRMLAAIELDGSGGMTSHVALLLDDLNQALIDVHSTTAELHELVRHPDIVDDKKLSTAIEELDTVATTGLAEFDAAAARLAGCLWERAAAESPPPAGRPQ